MDEDLVFNSSYSKLQDELTEAESKLHLARTQRNEAMTRIGELVKELEQCKTPESPETEAERERKALIADRLGVPSGGFLGPHVMLALDERDHLRSELAMAMQAVKNLEIAYEQSEDELKALKAESNRHTVDQTTDQVEALARVLRDAHAKHYGCEAGAYLIDGFIEQARAAIAHLAKPQPIKCIFCDFKGDSLAALKEHSAKCEAHPLAARPEGLPGVEELIPLIGKQLDITYDEKFSPYSSRGWEYYRAILTALRPWLRDPVGCELDVTAEELAQQMKEFWGDHSVHTSDFERLVEFVLDLCRSRIRPVFECKECAKNKSERDVMYRDWDDCRNRMHAVRLALNEGSES